MGHGAWSNTDYAVRSATYREKTREQLFSNRVISRDLDPRHITLRESCDSEESPESTAIILGLDVTGSMGRIAEIIAKQGLGTLVEGILDTRPVTDPHIMVMGIGDINSDQAPLQVSQFEVDLRIADQLTNIWLEGNGGGNSYESYDLPWLFAGTKTKIDCFDKRGKKGYLFTIGDELPPLTASRQVLKEQLDLNVQGDTSTGDVLKMAQKRYDVFHIVVEQGAFAKGQVSRVKEAWTRLLKGHVVMLDDYEHIAEVILSVMRVNEGADPEEVIESWQDSATKRAVRYSLYE